MLFCRRETSKEVGFTISILLLLTFERKDEINLIKEEQIHFYRGGEVQEIRSLIYYSNKTKS